MTSTTVFQEPLDFCEESMVLHDLVASYGGEVFDRVTQFRAWTVNDVLTHLHFWNVGAALSIQGGDAFQAFWAPMVAAVAEKRPLPPLEQARFDGLRGRALLGAWRIHVVEMAERLALADPKQRVQWAGPPMSVRSSISARLMETWAHGQEIYDVLGVARVDSDRIKSIAVLGVNTFSWSCANRGLAVPSMPPHVRLTAPSGAIWTWNDPQAANQIEGPATAFCQVVAQVRNVADVELRVLGQTAAQWMAIAQCFAGPPRRPPAPGTRCRAAVSA